MAGRRFALYFSWSRTRESTAPLGELENRFPALFELRRAVWPYYEWAADPSKYQQNIAGFLDHVILFDFKRFIAVIESVTGQRVRLLQREHEDSRRFLLENRLLSEVDTLVVVSLDHLRTCQRVSVDEIEAINAFLGRERSCLIVSPHHDIGTTGGNVAAQSVEFAHHGDRLVPAEQRLGGFARSVLAGLGLPIENRFGLRPASAVRDPTAPAPLEAFSDLDKLHVLDGVGNFNLHPHLPHLFVPESLRANVVVLAQQALSIQSDLTVDAHPFVAEGNRLFNSLVWAPPSGSRGGQVFVCDATLWSAAFGGLKSLEQFWQNLANLG